MGQSSDLQVAVIPFAFGFVILVLSICLGRSTACMLIIESMKANCLLEMKDEMEREPIGLWRAVVGI